MALVSRNGLDKTRQFPEVVEAVRSRHIVFNIAIVDHSKGNFHFLTWRGLQ